MNHSFFSSTLASFTLASSTLATLATSFTFGFPCLGFMKQKHEQQGHWNKNFIASLCLLLQTSPEPLCKKSLSLFRDFLSSFLSK
ncbi:hypothetical protein OIU74_000455 [Salix koriyanagi]|uniref:Secreted protein n=1 Tax=Salix koriyanagi TaxID=2511006 RepID=A0A9Q1AMD9_9ROSI|nr:hypothetical protein OIU74_000455 [Salix koriyanagi]